MMIREVAIGLSIGPAYIAAARTAVSLTGALTRAIGTATAEVVSGAKPTFEQIFAGQSDPVAADADPPKIADQLTDRIKNLLREAGIELAAPVTLAVSGEGTLVVEGQHPQRELIETAIAHDTAVEQLIAQWEADSSQSQGREPLGLTIAPTFNRPDGF
jgi:glycerol kinase